MPFPTKLTPEAQKAITDAIAVGNYFETACAIAGVSKQQAYEWLKKGAKGKKPFAAFRTAVEEAMSRCEQARVATVLAASREQWQAAAWWLERRFPQKWGRKDRMDIDQNSKVEIVVTEPGVPGTAERTHHTDDDLDG